MSIWLVMRLTWKELERRRLLIVLLLVTLVTVVLSDWGLHSLYALSLGRAAAVTPGEMKLAASQELVLFLFMFSGVVVLTAVAAGAPAIASDLEAQTLPQLLARPIRRVEVLLGKWLALAAVLTVYIAVTSALEIGVVLSIVGYRAPHPVIAVIALVAEGLVVMSLALMLGTVLSAMAAGVVAAAAFFLAWAAGVTGGVGTLLHNAHLVEAATVIGLVIPSDGLWRTAVFNLEPAVVVQAGLGQAVNAGLAADPFFVTSSEPLAFYLWVVVWTAVVVGLAIRRFGRREL